MSAYIIVFRESPVSDDDAITEYSRRNRANAKDSQDRFGVVPLVAYGAVQALEGASPDGVVLLKFPNVEAARNWYQSEAYQDALPFRQLAAKWRVVLVDGLD